MENHTAHEQNDFKSNTSLAVHLNHSGLLASHVYFGSCFFVLGAWWFTSVLKAQCTKGKRHEAALSFSGKCGACSSKMGEGLVKLTACIVGLIVEAITVKALGRSAIYTYDTIYASFMLAALVDILTGLRIVLPEGIDYLAHAVGFANLAVLARSQAWGHLHLTVATRLLTSYVAIFAAGSLLFELYRPQSQVLKFIRTGAVMVQGVWLWQAGIVLDSPFAERWLETDHANLMFITIAFSWDMCGVVLFQIFYAVIVEKLCGKRNYGGSALRYRPNERNEVNEHLNGEAVDDYKPLRSVEPVEVPPAHENA